MMKLLIPRKWRQRRWHTLMLMFLWLLPVAQAAAQDTEENSLEDEISAAEKKKEEPDRPGSFAGLVDRASIPDIFLAVDLGGAANVNNNQGENQALPADAAGVREAEMGFSGAIDQMALGALNFAAHEESGEYKAELHEAYLEFNRLPARLHLKLGQFFLDAGRLNSIHRHDWIFTQAPLVSRKIFGDEGVADAGGELSFLMPLPFFQEWKIGVFNGRTFGHSHTSSRKVNPLYTARLKNFFPLGENTGLEIGLSFLRFQRDTTVENTDNIGGLDFDLRWGRGFFSVRWGNEIWAKQSVVQSAETENRIGAYSFLELRPAFAWSFGIRADFFTEYRLYDTVTQSHGDNNSAGQSVWAGYRTSEFLNCRLSFERQAYHAEPENFLLLAQLTFLLGKHPAHKY